MIEETTFVCCNDEKCWSIFLLLWTTNSKFEVQEAIAGNEVPSTNNGPNQ